MNTTNSQITTAQAQQAITISEMYQVGFGHAPDAAGLAYWMNDLAHGQTMHDVAKNIGTYIPSFNLSNINSLIDGMALNGTGGTASPLAHNHWHILAHDAVPSYEYMYELSLAITGQHVADWAIPLV